MRVDRNVHVKQTRIDSGSSCPFRLLKTGAAAVLVCGSSLVGVPALATEPDATKPAESSAQEIDSSDGSVDKAADDTSRVETPSPAKEPSQAPSPTTSLAPASPTNPERNDKNPGSHSSSSVTPQEPKGTKTESESGKGKPTAASAFDKTPSHTPPSTFGKQKTHDVKTSTPQQRSTSKGKNRKDHRKAIWSKTCRPPNPDPTPTDDPTPTSDPTPTDDPTPTSDPTPTD
ncbi:MAG: hypothetical protein CMH41_06320, partial [Micrococcales bacterium]|nr:hypothetical protein [Micrococcales bacterium]